MKKMLVIILFAVLMLPGGLYAKRSHMQHDCVDVATLKTDGSGNMRTKKRGGNYASIPLNTLEPGQVIRVIRKSGNVKYVTLHGRYQGGIWRTIYQGPITEFPVSKYLMAQKKDKKCTNVIVSVNGAHEKYEPIVCEAVVKVCGKKSSAMDHKPPMDRGCRDAGTLKTDGSGNMRTKKRGGNYASIPLNTLTPGQVIRVVRTSGNLKYVTLHGRYQGGIWRTIYQGPITEFPVSKYLMAQKKDKKCTNVIVSVNGAHEKYEPIVCEAVVKVCGKKGGAMDHKPPMDRGCRDAGTLKTDGSGNMRTKKRGGNYASIPLNTLESGQVIRVMRKSGNLKYVTLHGRYQGGIWRTIYQGPLTEFPVDQYLSNQKRDKRCTNVIVSVNGAHEKYEPVACEAVVKVCGKKGRAGQAPAASLKDLMKKEIRVALKAQNGQFVCALNGGGGAVVANRPSAKNWETFTMVPLPGENKVAFKAQNGQFVCAESGGGRELVVNRSWAKEWETFTLVPKPGHNSVALKAYNGQFVTVEHGNGDKVTVRSSQAGPWETFTLVPMK